MGGHHGRAPESKEALWAGGPWTPSLPLRLCDKRVGMIGKLVPYGVWGRTAAAIKGTQDPKDATPLGWGRAQMLCISSNYRASSSSKQKGSLYRPES